MKKILFSILAISLLSTTAVFADGGKKAAKKQATNKTCPKGCPKTKDCSKNCPIPGCVCG